MATDTKRHGLSAHRTPLPSAVEVLPEGPRSVLAEAGGMGSLLVVSLLAFVRRPSVYGRDTLEASWIVVRRCAIPLSLSVFVLGFGALGVEAGVVLDAIGAPDRTGGVYVTAAVREIATWVTAMVVAGVAGTAACADLGARRIREELDALEVLGIPTLRLVVPWVVALTIVTPLLLLVAVTACMLSGVLAVAVLYDTTLAGFGATFAANFAAPELWGSLVKTTVFGGIIAAVCCYKGMNAKGGAQGVGRAVNQAVVISFAALWIVNFVLTSITLALFPELQALR